MDIVLSLEEVREIEGGRLISAMRAIRQRTGCGLLEAQQAVKRYQSSGLVSVLTEAQELATGLRDTTTADVIAMLITRLRA